MVTTTLNELQVAPRVRLRDRILVRLHERRLDIALARGAPAEASAELALRARRLTAISFRRRLARTIRRVVRDVDWPAPPSAVRVSPQPSRVAAAADVLSQLADALAQPRPVSASGVAQALILFTDGTGPLFNRQNYGSVRNRASAAIADLTITWMVDSTVG